jgi:hypothetical protein
VTRSRSINRSVAGGSKRSSNTTVAPACRAEINVKLNPPTQNSGIGE